MINSQNKTRTMESQPQEMIINIFENLSLSDLIKTESVCKKFRDLIRSTKWSNVIVKLKCIVKILYVVDNYQFLNYDFSRSEITDYVVQKLSHCHTLDLSECNITDDGLKYLNNCVYLDISSCRLVTDAGSRKTMKIYDFQ